MMQTIAYFFLCSFLVTVEAFSFPLVQWRLGSQPQHHHDTKTRHGAVACESQVCSDVGASVLTNGGNAADAIVSTTLCVGVIGMYHSGIAGGGFAAVRIADGRYEVVDFRETAPAAATEDMYKDDIQQALFGGLASGVPGELRGLEYIHQRYGQLPWPQVVQPAIDIARNGFNVTADLVRYMNFSPNNTFLTQDPSWALDFAPNGSRIAEGDIMTRKRYAGTLEAIAQGGAKAFYEGPLAEATISALRSRDGIMTLEDLSSYRVKIRKPVELDYHGYRIIGCSAPAGGSVVLSALETMKAFNYVDQAEHRNLSTHRLDEAVRFAYGERSSLGDPEFSPETPIKEGRMLDPHHAAAKRRKISDQHTLDVSDYNPDGFEILESHGTSQISAADESGLTISLTSTINLIFGNQIMVPETGVILNDQMIDFSIPHQRNAFGYPPSPSNFIRPGKRPMSSMAPTIVERGQPSCKSCHQAGKPRDDNDNPVYHVTGAAGGSRIITAVIQDLWHTIDAGMSLGESLAQARFHDMLLPNVISFEWGMNRSDSSNGSSHHEGQSLHPWAESGRGTGELRGFDNQTVAFMQSRGHNVTWVPAGFSMVHALRRHANGTWEAAGDPRQLESGGRVV